MPTSIDRGAFLRFGAAGVIAAAAGGVAAWPARAGLPVAAPIGDDVGFVQFGAVAERTAQAFYRHALRTTGMFDRAERRDLDLARRHKREHVMRLNAVLGADAVAPDDFEVVFPAGAFTRRDRALALGQGLEALLIGVYLDGVAFGADAATRLLLGRLLATASQQRGALLVMSGAPASAGLPTPLDIEQAGAELDKLLSVPGAPR